MTDPAYLGDGCYVSYDGWQFWLYANSLGSHERVALEPAVLQAFLDYVSRTMDMDITVTPRAAQKPSAS